jgi:hypothetical protein
MTVTRMRDVPGSMDVFARALERRRKIVPPREGRGAGGAETDVDEDATDGNASTITNVMEEGKNTVGTTTATTSYPPPINAAIFTAAIATQRSVICRCRGRV